MKILLAALAMPNLLSSIVLAADRVPVIVELFTSEGCSSCPRADELLAKLAKDQPVENAQFIPLAFHVDYWNNLGWQDRFASRQFTQRQYDYADGGRVYTPQMIVDGISEFVGSDSARARASVEAAGKKPKPSVNIAIKQIQPNQVTLQLTIAAPFQLATDQTADLLVALTEDDLTSDVKRGENAGRKLHHAAVVRSLKVVASASGPQQFKRELEVTCPVDKVWQMRNLKAIAFVQDRASHQVLAAGITELQTAAQ